MIILLILNDLVNHALSSMRILHAPIGKRCQRRCRNKEGMHRNIVTAHQCPLEVSRRTNLSTPEGLQNLTRVVGEMRVDKIEM